MACLDNIVTLGVCPDEAASTSGLKLMQAAGISIKNLAEIANETYGSGVELAIEKKQLALTQVKNDFIAAMQANNVVTDISHVVYDTSIFNPASTIGASVANRGVTVFKAASYRGRLRKTYLKAIQVFPLMTSGTNTLTIISNNKSYTWEVELTANQVNTFDGTQLSGFPFLLEGDNARVMFNGTDTTFASAVIKCGQGCNGAQPNGCGYANGWDGSNPVKSEGYGVNVQFYCECDYTQILCDLAPSYSGELIWLKWQILLFEEQLMSNRFNDWVIYNEEQIQNTHLPQLRSAYNNKWNSLMQGMLGILNAYRDDCLNCRGIKWVTVV